MDEEGKTKPLEVVMRLTAITTSIGFLFYRYENFYLGRVSESDGHSVPSLRVGRSAGIAFQQGFVRGRKGDNGRDTDKPWTEGGGCRDGDGAFATGGEQAEEFRPVPGEGMELPGDDEEHCEGTGRRALI